MQAFGEYPEWVVCHQVTREVAGVLVRCPARGPVLSDECLRCRYLTTSSVERTAGPWCELGEPPSTLRVALPIELPVRQALGPGVVPLPAVRTVAPVQSARPIGT